MIPPFAPAALWNLPAAAFRPHPDSARLVGLLLTRGARGDDPPLTVRDWTYPVWEATPGTPLRRVVCRRRTWGNLHGRHIPWDDSWSVSGGWWDGDQARDAQAIVLDPATGREWDLWQVSRPGTAMGGHPVLRVGSGSLVPGDYRTGDGVCPPVRGCGLACSAMLLRPADLESGEIRHALSAPVAGLDRGGALVPPAAKTDGPAAAYAIPDGIPMGTGFALDIAPEAVASWAAGLALSDAGRRSAAILAQGLRACGWRVTDNASTWHLQAEDRASAGARWDALGLGRGLPAGAMRALLRAGTVRALGGLA